MLKLPRNFFTNLSTTQYKEYLKLLPNLNDEKTKLYTMLAFTLAASSFFGIFAIQPTLSTIAEEKRQLADLEDVYNKLLLKSQSLSILENKYRALNDAGDINIVFNALPKKPDAPKLLAQINTLLGSSKLEVISLQVFGTEITPNKNNIVNKTTPIGLSLEAEGSYEDILTFIQSLSTINRLMVIESLSIVKSEKGDLSLKLLSREYFKP